MQGTRAESSEQAGAQERREKDFSEDKQAKQQERVILFKREAAGGDTESGFRVWSAREGLVRARYSN